MTVFGFGTTGNLPAVLEELRPSGGDILQHRLGSGAWAHVRYADWRQQQQALAKNGKVVHGLMLGVLEGIHPTSDCLDATASRQAQHPNVAIPLRVQQRHPGPSLRASAAIGTGELGKADWWTRLCEYVFGW